ncbi:MAG: LysR family glycine cleavage system transcriptional activator [Pseudohongiellaceae bacterium]
MPAKLQSLDSLRYFEAVARHLSFTLAAKELCLTQSAVSQKIIQLEARLGYALFERKIRQINLTSSGNVLFTSVRDALSQIKGTLDELDISEFTSGLNIYCMPSFANRWLMPRLNNFQESFPNININLLAENPAPDFMSEEINIGIFHGLSDNKASMHQSLLMGDYIYPVASPKLVKKIELKNLHDLNNTNLIHDSLPNAKLASSWQKWLFERGVNIDEVDYNKGYKYNQADLVIRAAIDSHGVALAHHVLVAKAIEEGRLVRVFDDISPCEAVHIVCFNDLLEHQPTRYFYDWILMQAKAFEQKNNPKALVRKSRLSTDCALITPHQ